MSGRGRGGSGPTERRIRVFENPRRRDLALAGRFVGAAAAACRARGSFSVALTGGGTPRDFYQVLASDFRDFVDWRQVHFFWSDERYVAPTDPESNVRLAVKTLLDPVSIPASNVHAPRTDLARPDDAALEYEGRLRSFFEPDPPRFDWVLLGLGADGHVASLFPGSAALEERDRLVIAVENAPSPPPVRLTMTLPVLIRGRQVHFLVGGEEKREAVGRTLILQEDLPARRVDAQAGSVQWWLDRAAAGQLGRNGKGLENTAEEGKAEAREPQT